ncbi:ABC transporter ATP-binding protein [Companilactobacillus sp. FL22-1]|uniref:ABC transporter ATP-binding protein n=1 Tax=Companilactobacillus sp. FL22-1 TaxID=3373892 RepID=UPI0037550BBB
MVEIAQFQDYSFQYNNSQKLSLDKINFSLAQGDFITLIGATGSGKSTFLKQFLPKLAAGRVISGQLVKTTQNISYVSQFVDNQMIMENPRDELKFVLDNQGASENEIQLRITEIASFLGIIDLLDQPVKQLSGGQKQLVNLASALILKPDLLLLDEPTAQLDPVASEKLLQMVHKVNVEFNMTIVLVEHELEQAVKFTKRLLIMEDGQLCLNEPINKALPRLFENKSYRNFLTQIDRLALELNLDVQLPINNQNLNHSLKNQLASFVSREVSQSQVSSPVLLAAKNISFRFEFNGRQIIDNVTLQLETGHSYCIVGPNGMGKTTLLKVLTQQLKPQSGKLSLNGQSYDQTFFQQVFVLPQNPADLFMKETVAEELSFQIKQSHSSQTIAEILGQFSLTGLEEKSPYDLSGGQQEFLALALGFIKNPAIIFLDEPTKGLDPNKRIELGHLLHKFQKQGGTILANSHDLLFAASYFDQIAMMFAGKLSEFAEPVTFFSDKFFYTTEINKALRDIFPQALTWKDVLKRES